VYWLSRIPEVLSSAPRSAKPAFIADKPKPSRHLPLKQALPGASPGSAAHTATPAGVDAGIQRKEVGMVAVLQLDSAGVAHRWISVQDAAIYGAKGLVLWEIGAPVVTLRGGRNAATGRLSTLDVAPVIALAGGAWCAQEFRTPAVERRLIFARDRYTCAYCAQRFAESQLTVDHIVPASRGGAYSYMNLLAACRACNARKGARSCEEARMLPIWAPYLPCRNEAFLLANRKVLADQYEYLAARLPKHSRLRLQ
jgi:hypothetical protein